MRIGIGGGRGWVGFWALAASFLALETLGLLAVIMRPAAAQAPGDLFYLPPDSEVDDGDDFIIPPDSDVIGLPPGEGGGEMLLLTPTVIVLKPPDHLPPPPPPDNPTPKYAPVFCALRKPPLNSQQAQLQAVGNPPPGSYAWTCGSWQGVGPNPM